MSRDSNLVKILLNTCVRTRDNAIKKLNFQVAILISLPVKNAHFECLLIFIFRKFDVRQDSYTAVIVLLFFLLLFLITCVIWMSP